MGGREESGNYYDTTKIKNKETIVLQGYEGAVVVVDNITKPRTSSGVYICKSIVNDLKHGNYICKSEVIYLTYEHRIEIPVEFTYVNQ